MSDFAAELSGFPVAVRWPVQWGDQDAFGHVNNTVYFRWFETCRIEYLHRMGLDDSMLQQQQLGPILAAISCQYRRPVTFPDTVQIAGRVTRLGRSSLTMEHRLYSEAMQIVAAEGDSTIVVYDYGRAASAPIPDEMRKVIEQIEGRTFG
ncbi:MAG TPA: thioesterase family protein [Pirellulales bacterium]|nr:thioesterase family protein [Pirellulales bacterium]